MAKVTIKQLLEAGVHFGHQTQRWNPKMKKYIFGERNGIYIINLEITLECITKALEFVREVSSQGKELLLVGTKRQAQQPLKEFSEACGMPYVDQRWLGGMLTNFETVRKSVSRLDEIDKMEEEGSFQFMKKKEVAVLTKERDKLTKNLHGVRKMRKLPGALFIVDAKKEEIAIKEAYKLGIPIIAVLDTNSDPDLVDYPIPGNDDAIRAIKLFCSLVADAVAEGRKEFEKNTPAEEDQSAEVATEASEAAAEPSKESSEATEVPVPAAAAEDDSASKK